MPTPRAYYNEIDIKAAAWLRELIKAGHIAPGDVDDRSIADVAAADIKGYTQCHFFAGIGGWSYALRLAGWPDDKPVWTGSCPCQPFSAAGKRGGTDDARHLWPEFYRLIGECRPTTIFGEQVASKDGLAWLDIVSSDLERTNYAIGAVDMCAAGVGAPHIRQRLFFVAHTDSQRHARFNALLREENDGRFAAPGSFRNRGRGESSNTVGLADGNRPGLEISGPHEQRTDGESAAITRGDASQLAESPRPSRCWRGNTRAGRRQPTDGSHVGDTGRAGAGRDARTASSAKSSGSRGGFANGDNCSNGAEPASANGDMADADGRNTGTQREQRSGQHRLVTQDSRVGAWDNVEFIPCTDGKARPIESGTFPLAHGVPHRVGLLRGYGNAIVPQVAAEFIGAYLGIVG